MECRRVYGCYITACATGSHWASIVTWTSPSQNLLLGHRKRRTSAFTQQSASRRLWYIGRITSNQSKMIRFPGTDGWHDADGVTTHAPLRRSPRTTVILNVGPD